MNKYERLTSDLAEALRSTEHLEQTEDGGTCNFDAPTLRLPRWNRSRTEAAIKAAGISGWFNNGALFGCWVLSIPASGQGNRNTRRAVAVQNELKAAGYDSGMYYQTD